MRLHTHDENFTVDIHFLVGGTQTNLTVISAALRACEGALCAFTGHIQVHEAGAVEATGHKVLTLPSADGKITSPQVEKYVSDFYADATHEHMVIPRLVYISQPTELGTLYSKSELYALRDICLRRGLLLYMDGARLGYGLAADPSVTLRDCALCCDAFYIGGTKVGALFGEALVIRDGILRQNFRNIMKQKGAILAKGRLLGLQFAALFGDGLYFRISEHAITLARRIRQACADAGFDFLVDSPTNQQFPILPDNIYAGLSREFVFEFWQKIGADRTAVRICTSWATDPGQVDKLCGMLKSN